MTVRECRQVGGGGGGLGIWVMSWSVGDCQECG